MRASRCGCGKVFVLSRQLCPSCGGQMSPVELGDDAVLLTHTTLLTVPEGFEAPIHLALVELENGSRLLCVCRNDECLEIGTKGRITLEGEKYYFSCE